MYLFAELDPLATTSGVSKVNERVPVLIHQLFQTLSHKSFGKEEEEEDF